MSLERGGRGDKEGNRYEDHFFAKLLLELLQEYADLILNGDP